MNVLEFGEARKEQRIERINEKKNKKQTNFVSCKTDP